MKTLKTLLILAVSTLLLSAGLSAAFHTDPHSTLMAVGSFNLLFYSLTSYGIINLPANALGSYVGAPGVSTESGGAGVQVINTERARGAYMSYRTRPEYDSKDISPSFLRLEAVITNTSNIIRFNTFVGDTSNVATTETRLDRNDKFVVTEMGLFLLKQLQGQSGGRLHSYPNATDFAAAAPFLESLFNGILKMTMNKKQWISALDTQRFLNVPETQQSAGTNRDMFSLHKKLYRLTPHIEIDGSGTNEIELQYPTYAGWAGASATAGTDHKAVLYLHGLLISGGSANT